MGVVMKIYSVFVTALSLFMFIYKMMKEKMVRHMNKINNRYAPMSSILATILDYVS